jgi:hypothetical protein
VKANHVEYEYVAKNQYFISGSGSAKETAATNNVNAYAATPSVPPPPPLGISFKPGTVEIKSAWRPLNKNDQPARFHVQTVRFYEKKGPNNLPCYFEQRWGLIALHIVQKTPSAPAFIYATFEQTDAGARLTGRELVVPDGTLSIRPPMRRRRRPRLLMRICLRAQGDGRQRAPFFARPRPFFISKIIPEMLV